ncbi:MAG: SIS domain-containing protein [Lentisphaeria bacterium]|nr:SIS domain-containing protein [Lentisphaeria bacterium]
MENQQSVLQKLAERYPQLEVCIPALTDMIDSTVSSYRQGGKFIVAGNGGSAADAEHICGELLKGFRSKRSLTSGELKAFTDAFGEEGAAAAANLQGGLPALSLISHPGFNTAYINDCDPLNLFAQQLWAQGNKGDIFLAISTGGNSGVLRRALMTARVRGIKSFLLTGNRHGICEKYADVTIAVPESETYKIQELHLPVYHAFCAAVESNFWELSC